jgi:acyl-CoA thioesterase FadM
VNDLGDYTCTYGFLVSSETGRVPYARGERVVVNVDPATHRAAKWSRDFVSAHADLRKDLPAYA